MNPDLKVLRVAVVPTETGNGIDQRSTVEEILACSETKLFSVPDYFQAQNDSDIDLLHWSFLINIETNADLTGSNTDGIDYFSEQTKAGKIKRIQHILNEWGSTSCCELELDHSPSLNSMAGGNIAELVEEFDVNTVSAVTYDDDMEIGWNDYTYDELSDDVIDEILEIMEDYDVAQQKLFDSTKNENF
jgi:hypothetical protein